MTFVRNILITGGAGFIGSHLVQHFVKGYPAYQIINLDNLTYAGNLENLKEIDIESPVDIIINHIKNLISQALEAHDLLSYCRQERTGKHGITKRAISIECFYLR